MNLVQNAPVTGADPPCTCIAYKLGGLSWARILRKTVDDTADLPLHGAVKLAERFTGRITEDDRVSHALQPGLGLDLFP